MKKSATFIYLACIAPIHLGIHIYEVICINERDVELQKEKCQKLTIAKGDNCKSKNKSCLSCVVHLHPYIYLRVLELHANK